MTPSRTNSAAAITQSRAARTLRLSSRGHVRFLGAAATVPSRPLRRLGSREGEPGRGYLRVVVKVCQARGVKRRTEPWPLSLVSRTATVALIVAVSTQLPPLPLL
jgi:hypothetical protein